VPVAEGFYAQDLFIDAARPGLAPAWRRLQLGDAEGAALLVEGIDGARVGWGALAQIAAAIAVEQDDLAAASRVLAEAVTRVVNPRERAALAFQLGLCSQARGDADAARAAFDCAAEAQPGRAATERARAEFAWATGGVAAGRLAFATATRLADVPEVWAAWARHERAADAEDEARAVLDAALDRHPGDADLTNILTAWFLKQKRYAEAFATVAGVTGEAAGHPFVLSNRGNALLGLRRFAEADACFQAALEAQPAFFEATFGRAMVAFDAGDAAAAESGLREALRLRPAHVEARLRLSDVRAQVESPAAGIAILKEILAEDPNCFAAHYQVAVLYFLADLYDDAERHARRALALDPLAKELFDLLGLLLLNRGERNAASESFAEAQSVIGPGSASYASNWAYTLHYDPLAAKDAVLAAHRAYGARFGGEGDDPSWRFANSPEPGRRLRVGYISPDFRAHSVAFFAAPLFSGHDRANVEVFAYSSTTKRDPMTGWIAETVDGWRDIAALTAEETRALIHADEIDILVDLAGHTANNPLPVFARRAAPVQVNYIGYPDTTGLPAMDYRIVDAITDPPGAEAFATETLVRLPRAFLCYRPVPDTPPVTAGPVARGEPFTFGTFNTGLKLNEPLFDAWAEILRAVPESRLLLKAKQYRTESARAWVMRAFTRRGIAAERITVMAFAPTLGSHLELYDRVDLALDTFPYAGTTTTCEALSMGVAVLGLKGDRHCARVGESLLGALGIDGAFVADDVADYVARAVDLAGRRDELSALRPEIRRRLLASELCDEPGLVRAVEAAYREMWRKWCADGPRCGLGPSRFDREREAQCARR
jgi:protein O-GlcNAc transferase